MLGDRPVQFQYKLTCTKVTRVRRPADISTVVTQTLASYDPKLNAWLKVPTRHLTKAVHLLPFVHFVLDRIGYLVASFGAMGTVV